MTILERSAMLSFFLLAFGGLALAHSPETLPSSTGFVLRPEEGEILVRTPERTENIKLSPRHGALGFGLVTSRLVGSKQKIAIHRHHDEQEAFFVHRGRGLFILGDQRIEVREGDIVFIPQDVWHGFETVKAKPSYCG